MNFLRFKRLNFPEHSVRVILVPHGTLNLNDNEKQKLQIQVILEAKSKLFRNFHSFYFERAIVKTNSRKSSFVLFKPDTK